MKMTGTRATRIRNKITNQTMNEIITNEERMTSVQIAEIVGKAHKNVMQAIRNMEPAWENVNGLKFQLVEYTDKKGEQRPCYSLTKEECLYIATKFNDEARAKLIKRWKELEMKQSYTLPQTFAQALALAAEQAKQIEEQQRALQANTQEILQLSNTISQMQPKISYYDRILASTQTMTVTQLAQDYGMSAKRFNALLHNIGIQHKVNEQWILYAKFLQCGYVHSKAVEIPRHDGTVFVKNNTEWTQKGRLFLYEELKKHHVLPSIERA